LFDFRLSQNTIFWDVTPRSPTDAKRRFGGTNYFYLQCRRECHGTNKKQGKGGALPDSDDGVNSKERKQKKSKGKEEETIRNKRKEECVD
jgi:hypothetical protein